MDKPIVLITGALTGIGRATALAFAREGATVIVSGRHDDEGQALAAELRATGAEAEFVRADVRNEEDVRALVDKTIERFGRLDVAVNNAGTLGRPGPITNQTAESYAAIFDTNVLGVLLSLKHELRVMMPKHHGSIVNISSFVGHVGVANGSVYSASKHAVDGLTQAAALEAAEAGVRVNGIAPGPIETAMLTKYQQVKGGDALESIIENVALKRSGTPDEVAQAIVFVASDKASFITGATLCVDGGQFAM
jgi:NAD(P)-dependent dehydrogenase (short-subunit alcohol dehydrogenase family)